MPKTMVAYPSAVVGATLWLCLLLLLFGCGSSFSAPPPRSSSRPILHCAFAPMRPRLLHNPSSSSTVSSCSSTHGDDNAMIDNNDNNANVNSKISEDTTSRMSSSSLSRGVMLVDDPAVSNQIVKARKLLDDARKKQQAREERSSSSDVTTTTTTVAAIPSTTTSTTKRDLPFFVMVDNNDRSTGTSTTLKASITTNYSKKIKSTTPTGTIIADGETMTQISSTEQWSQRTLSEMFSKESHYDYSGNIIEDDPTMDKIGTVLADRDVVASIWNLRKTLHNDDFVRVFDKRNRFIGDLD